MLAAMSEGSVMVSLSISAMLKLLRGQGSYLIILWRMPQRRGWHSLIYAIKDIIIYIGAGDVSDWCSRCGLFPVQPLPAGETPAPRPTLLHDRR